MSGRKLIVVAASVATLMSAAVVTAPLADAKPKVKPPAKVAKARVSAASTSAVTITWKNPKSKKFKATVVRIAAGTSAPKSVKKGRAAGTVSRKRHAVAITRLAPGTVYTVSLFSSDGKKHYSKPVKLRVRTAAKPKPAPKPKPKPTKGSIAGVVYGGNTKTKLGNVRVTAYPDNGNVNLNAVTASNGSYAFPSLTPDSYSVCFDADDQQGGTAPLGYQGACLNNGDDFVVKAGSKIAGSIVLVKASRLSGTIEGDGVALENVDLSIYDSQDNYIDDTYSDEDGSYSFYSPTGAVKICYDTTEATGGDSDTGYVSDCAPLATPVKAGDDATKNLNLTVHGGAIEGTVTNTAGDGVSSFVELFDTDGNYVVGTDNDETDGTYSLKGLKAGDYLLCFYANNDNGGPGNVSECYEDKVWSGDDNDLPDTSTLTPVPVTVNTPVTRNAVLADGGEISGTVQDDNGSAIDGQVTAFDADGHAVSSTHLDGDTNSFQLDGLPTGSYTVCFESHQGEYASQCYENQSWDGDSENLPGDTTPVSATAGEPGKDDVVMTIPAA